jgi:hypothetical protein
MHAFRKCAAGAALLAFSSAFGQAILIDDYTLQGTLADSLGGPSLASFGGSITPTGYVFAANKGLAFTNPALTPANFSIELSFSFDVTTGYRKIVDFLNLGSDSGLYQLNGNLNFYPVATTGSSDFASGVTADVVLTRDASTNMVTGYVNGVQRFTFADTSSLSIVGLGSMRLFVDDFATGQSEASGGTANYFRVFNGVLSSSQVNALFLGGSPLAVPEPPTLVLLTAGTLGVLGWSLRSKSRRKSGRGLSV